MGCCGSIFFQDVKERLVSWFLFPLLGIFLGLIFYDTVATEHFFLLSLVTNIALVTLIVLILFIYAKFILKKKFINHSFGMGDLLFFYAMAVGFPPLTFIVLFAGGVFFSLLLFFALKKRRGMTTVPLAGYMAIYLAIILAGSFFVESPSLYTL